MIFLSESFRKIVLTKIVTLKMNMFSSGTVFFLLEMLEWKRKPELSLIDVVLLQKGCSKLKESCERSMLLR